MSAHAGWRLVPRFLLRRAGFPFALLEALAGPRTAACAAQVVEHRARAEALRQQLLRQHFVDEVKQCARAGARAELRTLSRWRRRVGRGRAGETPAGAWSAPLRAAHEAWGFEVRASTRALAELESVLDAEWQSSRRALRHTFQRGDVREALFLLSPDLVDAMGPALEREPSPQPRAPERALERRLYAFAQRLAAKNETTSFFGPLAYGSVETEQERFSFGPEAPMGVTRREAFAAFWAVAALGKAAASDPQVRRALPVRRIPVSAVCGLEGQGPDGRKVALTPGDVAVLGAADGRRTAGELGAVLGLGPQEAEAAVLRLERAGFVRRDLEPRSTTAHPLEDVLRLLPDVPAAARWRETLRSFQALLRRFEMADLPGRRAVLAEAEALFEKATGQPARRAAGQTYADRTLLYEDCLGDQQPVRMPATEATRLERILHPAMALGAAYGQLRHQAVRTLAGLVLAELGRAVPFLTFISALEARVQQGVLEPLLAPARTFLEAWGREVRAVSDGRVARVAPERVLEVARAVEARGRFASPDVMLEVIPAGATRAVLGEVHPYVFAWGSQNQFAPDLDALKAAFLQDLSPWGGRERMATVLRRRRHKGLVSDAFPGAFIEVTGRSVDDAGRRLAIADLHVEAGADGPELVGPGGPLTLYAGEDDHPHLRAFAPPQVELPPLRLGPHTPRIEVGELVLQRERWTYDADGLSSLTRTSEPVSLALAVAEARRTEGWPRHLFVSSPSEPKPLCLDLDVPFAWLHLRRLARLGRVALTEMLPGPSGLWARRSSGGHTSELRMAMVRDA
ncbi:lantibiotic dehydratase [Myxococcaceae bacterium GXIMD 01537]